MAGVGVETAEQFCEYARSTYQVEVINSQFKDDLFEAESFDAVTLAGVLEHVENPIELLSQIARVLRPGGVLFLNVPNEGSFAFSMVNIYFRLRGRDWAVQMAPTFSLYHIQGFSKRSLVYALDRSGFYTLSLQTYPVGDDGFNPVTLSQKIEVNWRLIDRLSVLTKHGTGWLAYARKR